MLEAEKWEKVKDIFQTAMELAIAERQEFIEKESSGDKLIKAEVETLLEAHDEAGSFIVAPAVAVADFIEGEQKASLVGRQIGAYKIVREIGRGGMGAVYLAERADAEFEKKVAVKLIKRGLDTDEIVRRFRHERQILANLEHPNITRLIDGGATDDGLPFLVMEYVEGAPLNIYCDENRVELGDRLNLFLEICAAVQHAHRNLIVHRDLKPSNILVTPDGTPKLLDFGIAKLLTPEADFATERMTTNFNVMTPEYASPEQLRGEKVTTATDVYSLGVILYELLSGSRPHEFNSRSSLEKIIHTVCESQPAKPSDARQNPKSKIQNPKSLRGDLDNIVLMAMRKEPERRYSSVEQFAADIKRYLRGLPVVARTDSAGYRASKFVQRNKALVGAGAGIALSLVAGIVTTTRQARIARRERDQAERNRETAERNREQATRINSFLKKMLASADPRFGGKDAKVVEILALAADSIEKDFAGEPEIIADLRSTIGLTYLNLGQIGSAESHLRQSLEIRTALFGMENHETAMSLNNYGKLLQAKGDLKTAETLFRQSLAILRLVARETDALDIASVLGNLGYLLMLEAKYDEAKRAHHEELKILRARLGENHSEFARTLGNLANIYAVTGDKKTAEPMHRQALAVTQKFYGGEHPDVALAMLHLAMTITPSKINEAEALSRESLALRRRFFGDGHTETAWSLYYLGDVLLRKNDYERAADCAREILNLRGSSIPETHFVINSSLILLARCFLATNRPTKAETLLRECLRLRQETLPPEHWLIATTKSYLAECFLQTGRFDEAAPLLQESYKILLAKLGASHEHTKQAKERLEKLPRSGSII